MRAADWCSNSRTSWPPRSGSRRRRRRHAHRPARPGVDGHAERSIEASFARSATTGDNPLLPLHDASVDPADFTAPYVLLASSANSSNITGAIIPVDGGIAARGFRTAAGGDDL